MKYSNISGLIGLMIFVLVAGCSKSSPAPDNGSGTGNGGGSGSSISEFTPTGIGTQCKNALFSGSYKEGEALTLSNTVKMKVTVTRTGNWTLSTTTVNGISFSGAGTFSTTGEQSIVLKGAGTPLKGGTFLYTVSSGGTNCGFSIPVVSKSIVYIRGILYASFSFDTNLNPALCQSGDEFNDGNPTLNLKPLTAAGDTVIAKLVNARIANTNAWDNYYSSTVVVSFSNVNAYGAGMNINKPDTAGKLQLWVYRKDGNDIVPAANGKPAIKSIIHVFGKLDGFVSSGSIHMRYNYLNPWYNINAAFMENLFANTHWKLTAFTRRD